MSPTSCRRCGAPLSGEEARTALQGMCTKCLFELGLEDESHVVITGAAESPAPPPSPEELQPLFPQFEILEVLGQGGMGVVYRARQKGLDREVALKVLPARAGRNPAFAERFAREAKALASLSHPNITSVYDFGKAGEHFFLAMEFVDGLNLRALLRKERVSPKQALQIVEQICDALQYAHDQGVVHRDIKPENILLDRKGRLKITDFGLAKLLAREAGGAPSIGLTLTDQVMGTPHYMAPEQVERPAAVDHRADIYSLGVVFYELLTGELPLGRFAPPSGKVRVDVRLDEVVLRALEKEPELRYQSAGAVRTDVHGITEPGSGEKAAARAPGAGGVGRGAGVAGAGSHGHRPGHWWYWVVGASLLVLAFIAAAFAAMIVGGRMSRVQDAGEGQPVRVSVAETDAELLARSPAHSRLEAVPLFTGHELSLPFRTVFEVGEEVKEACKWAVLKGHEEYRPIREAHTRREISEPNVVRITIEPFPEEAREVVEEVQREMRALLPPEAYRYLVARQALEQEQFPAATERVVHELSRTPDGFAWMTSVGGASAVVERGEQLPGELGEHWRKMYQPLAASVATPLERFVEEARALDAGTGKVQFSLLEIESRAADVLLVATLFFKGADIEESSKLLGELRNRLMAAGMSMQEAPSQGSTEIAVRATFTIRESPLELPLPAASEPGTDSWDLVAILNQKAAAMERIALEPVVPDKMKGTEDWEDVLYKLKQPKSSARSLDGQLAWIRALEDLGSDSVVSSVVLQKAGEGSDQWVARVELLARQAR